MLLAGACPLATSAGAEVCAGGNMVPGAAVTGSGIRGHARTLADQFLPEEGTRWDATSTVVLADLSARVRVDFGSVLPVNALLLQADADDSYVVEGSTDDVTYSPLWVAPPAQGTGLRFRSAQTDRVRVRYLRVRALGGAGGYAVSELMAMCIPPGQSLLHAGAWVPERARTFTYDHLFAVKLIVALSGVGLFLSGLIARRRGTTRAGGRFRDGALAILGVAGALCWWNFGAFHFDGFLHREDAFHYFVGAKYFQELGYDGLYACTAVADAGAGFEDWARRRNYRDLRTNEMISGAALLEDAGGWRSRFTPERWRQFERDVAWFRSSMPPDRWALTMQDHGYNATPAWGMTARLLYRNLAASDGGVLALALIDPLLLVVLWGLLLWAFGWRAAAVATIWWGANLPAEFAWTGGGIMRQDWLLLAVAGVCLARRRQWASAGGALAGATLLRVYPVFLVAGLGLKALASMWRRRSFSLEGSHRRFAAGFLATAACVVALSSAANPRGAGAWSEFADASRVDAAHSGTNQVGLGVLLTYDPKSLLGTTAVGGENPVNLWQGRKSRVLASRRWLQVIGLLALSGLLLRRLRDAQDWEALVLGVGFIPFAASISSYYASIFLLYALLWENRREAAALPLAALAAWTQCAMLIWGKDRIEGVFFGVSAGLVIAIAVISAQRTSFPAGAVRSDQDSRIR